VAAPVHVLVVDDDPALLENIAECLSGEGFEVSLARSGAAALLRLGEAPRPTMAIIDQLMPGMTGTELVARIRQQPALAGIRLLLVSGLPPARITGGRDLEADAVLEKPFGVEALVGAVRAQLAAAAAALPS
jgi:CheY-like chemotaxis protein